MQIETLLTVNQVAAILAVGSDHVRKLARDRKIGHRKIGRRMYFTIENVNAYFRGTTVERIEQ